MTETVLTTTTTHAVVRLEHPELPSLSALMLRDTFSAKLWWVWIVTRAVPETFWFIVWPLCDKRGEGVSITRLLVVCYTVMLWHIIESPPTSHPVTTNMLWLAIASIAAGFGKSTFSFFLARAQFHSDTSATESTTTDMTAIVQAIAGRREAGASEGSEPTR